MTASKSDCRESVSPIEKRNIAAPPALTLCLPEEKKERER